MAVPVALVAQSVVVRCVPGFVGVVEQIVFVVVVVLVDDVAHKLLCFFCHSPQLSLAFVVVVELAGIVVVVGFAVDGIEVVVLLFLCLFGSVRFVVVALVGTVQQHVFAVAQPLAFLVVAGLSPPVDSCVVDFELPKHVVYSVPVSQLVVVVVSVAAVAAQPDPPELLRLVSLPFPSILLFRPLLLLRHRLSSPNRAVAVAALWPRTGRTGSGPRFWPLGPSSAGAVWPIGAHGPGT